MGVNNVRMILGALILLAAPITHAQESATLKRVYKAGETERYKTVITIDAQTPMGPQKGEITMLTTEKTKEVKDDGTVVLTATLDSGSVRFGEGNVPLPTVILTTTLNKDGKIVKEEGGNVENAPSLPELFFLTRNSVFATHALKIGEEWKYSTALDTARKRTVKGSLTLVSREPKSEEIPIESLKIRTVKDGVLGSGKETRPVHIEAISLLEPDTGKDFRTEGAIVMKTAAGELKMTFTRLRLQATNPKP